MGVYGVTYVRLTPEEFYKYKDEILAYLNEETKRVNVPGINYGYDLHTFFIEHRNKTLDDLVNDIREYFRLVTDTKLEDSIAISFNNDYRYVFVNFPYEHAKDAYKVLRDNNALPVILEVTGNVCIYGVPNTEYFVDPDVVNEVYDLLKGVLGQKYFYTYGFVCKLQSAMCLPDRLKFFLKVDDPNNFENLYDITYYFISEEWNKNCKINKFIGYNKGWRTVYNISYDEVDGFIVVPYKETLAELLRYKIDDFIIVL